MFTCFTGSRTSEVLGMKWPEVDFETDIWTCPAKRMKSGDAYRVPLTAQMLEILQPLTYRVSTKPRMTTKQKTLSFV